MTPPENPAKVHPAVSKEAIVSDRWGYVVIVIFAIIVAYGTLTMGIDEVSLRR